MLCRAKLSENSLPYIPEVIVNYWQKLVPKLGFPLQPRGKGAFFGSGNRKVAKLKYCTVGKVRQRGNFTLAKERECKVIGESHRCIL